jgi:ligand-binding sensor domain-containing protein
VLSGPALAQWENHVDASLINEIVYRDGELFMATGGGILIYSPASGQFEQYDNTSGLPSNSLTCLKFDEAGDLWVGTGDVGIAKVTMGPSGLNVRMFSPLAFPNLSITSIDIWEGEAVYGTKDGAGMFEQGLPGPTFSEAKGLPNDLVYDVFADGAYVWFATAGGAAVLDRFGFITPVEGGPPVARVVEKSDDAIWVGTDDGVWKMALSDSSWTQVGPSDYKIYSLHWDGQTMWAGGSVAFYEYDNSVPQWIEHEIRSLYYPYGMPSSGVNGQVLSLTREPGGDIYLGATTESYQYGINLVRYDGQLENLQPNNPGENRMIRLSYDSVEQAVWVSCEGFGVSKLTRSGQWVNYNRSIPEAGTLSSLYANTTLLADSQGHKWFSTLSWSDVNPLPMDELDDKRDAVYSNDEWTRHLPGSGGGQTYGTARPQRGMEDPVGNRWFLADEADEAYHLPIEWRGIHILNREGTEWLQVRPGTTNQEMEGGNITHVAFRDDLVFVAIKDYGVQSWYHGGYDWQSLNDFDDDIWGGEIDASLDNPRELGDANSVSSLALRSDGILWIGTDVGVYKFNPDGYTFKLIADKVGNEVGLLAPNVNFIVLDHYENLWVATEFGLNKISREDDNDIEAFTTTAAYQFLSENAIPYPSSVISPLAGTVCVELLMHPYRGELYIATKGGLSIFKGIDPPPQQPTDLDQVYVYPNPVDGSKGWDTLFIDNVDAPVTIHVYDLEGNLVHGPVEVSESEAEIWDLKTMNNFTVASGTYFVRIDNGESSVVIPVAVVR